MLKTARANNILISGKMLKAEELSEELDFSTKWVCSSGWFSQQKKRHSIKYGVLSEESASVDNDTGDDWKQNILLPFLQCYQPADVFNTDETGLFWHLLPDKTHLVSKSKERVIIPIWMEQKYPLLTIGKFLKPRCFRGITCLPTEYDANHNAWMTSVLFERWLIVILR